MKKILPFFLTLSAFVNTDTNMAQTVHLISISSSFDETKIEEISEAFYKKKYTVNFKYLDQFASDLGYVNTDEERADNLINALTDNKVELLWAVRGGGGALNILPELKRNLSMLQSSKPKTLIGFSDVTAVHLFINQYLPEWKTIHAVTALYSSDLANSDKEPAINDREPIPDIDELLTKGLSYKKILPLNGLAKKAIEGVLIGGNLTLIQSTFGTDFEPDFTDKIVLMEDVNITYRQLDRMLNQLLMHHNIQQAKGFLFGQFYPLEAMDSERLIFKTVIENFAKQINKPVYYYPLIGHGRKNRPVILGDKAKITCNTKHYCTLYQGSTLTLETKKAR